MNQPVPPVPPAPEAPKDTCPACEVASTIKDVEEVKLWFELVRQVLEASDAVKDFLAKNT
jgi:hypothetical protein